MEDDATLVARLQGGDEAAFAALVRRYQAQLLRLAEATVGSRAVAQEVTQDTWMAVVRGVHRFEGRSSLRTWLFRILVNRARTTAGRERRAGRPAEDLAERFDDAGAWADPPEPWADRAEDRLLAAQLAQRVQELLPSLPDLQRQVVLLRDVDGVTADEACRLLDLTDGNQRVLLHRGRTRLRALLEREVTSS